jgi:asparagine synthase (glutamine-hydrolysing)
MCGIAGIVKLDPARRVEADRLARMRDELTHRGPDDAGLWLDGPVGLAHRRLSIVDVAGGHQPMASPDADVHIVFNGEIYNHPALRPELEARGHRYATRSDTETILHLYEEEGAACVEKLRGMFAFALWDRGRRELLLARDRLGIKPLYYAEVDGELMFASEIKALVAGGLRPRLHVRVLPELLATGFVAGDETLFVGVRKLLPGRTLVWSAAGGLRERRYWRPPEPAAGDGPGFADEAAELRRRLEEVVVGHLMSDVPVGVFLSGGIDSTAIAALAAPHLGGPLRTFSVGFADPACNELPYARLAAAALGAEHHEVVVGPEDFFGALPRLMWHEDEPPAFPSSVPLYFVSKLAAEHVKVVLTGEGADELFLGYNRYRVTAWNARLGRLFWAAPPPLRRALGRAALALAGPARRYLAHSFLAVEPGPRALFCENWAIFPTPLQRHLLRDAAALDARDPYAAELEGWAESGDDLLGRMSRADLSTYLVELLMKQDQMSMAASVESRVPFLDHELVEHVVGLPSRLKLRGVTTKAVLREALRDVVPEAILRRRKLGFPVPLGGWLRGPYYPVLRDLLLSRRALERGLFEPAALAELIAEHRAGVRDHAHQLFLLMGLELWLRRFVDGDDRRAALEVESWAH